MAGWQEVLWDNRSVSQIDASGQHDGQFVHDFEIELPVEQGSNAPPEVLKCRILADICWQPFEISYQLYVNDELQDDGKRSYKDVKTDTSFELPRPKKATHWIGLLAALVKILKSSTVIKTAWLGGSLLVYSALFNMLFAVALIVTLMIHEYGRVQALKYYGFKTRGIYLIPFYGGFAVRDEIAASRWQGVVIALAGPCFGLMMSFVYTLVYGLTGNIFFGALASFNALINLFNLLPILPLAGGHVLKHVTFSMSRTKAIIAYVALAGIGGAVSLYWSLPLFAALLLAGLAEMVVAWRQRSKNVQLPMTGYGQGFAMIWYAVVVICFMEIVWFFAGTGKDVLGLPLEILLS